MIHHGVLFSWKAPMTADAVAAVGRALDDMVATMPYVRSYHHGVDAGLKDGGNADYGIVATFDDCPTYAKCSSCRIPFDGRAREVICAACSPIPLSVAVPAPERVLHET